MIFENPLIFIIACVLAFMVVAGLSLIVGALALINGALPESPE